MLAWIVGVFLGVYVVLQAVFQVVLGQAYVASEQAYAGMKEAAESALEQTRELIREREVSGDNPKDASQDHTGMKPPYGNGIWET